MAKRYEEAKLAVTMVGMLLLNTSAIIGLATLIRPMPPVHNMAEKKKTKQTQSLHTAQLVLEITYLTVLVQLYAYFFQIKT